MNHEQWEALKAATKYHARGPWGHELFSDIFAKSDNRILAASAPDLLAEVERLREWLMVISREAPTLRMVYMAESALNGAEVPK